MDKHTILCKEINRQNAATVTVARDHLASYRLGRISRGVLCEMWGLDPREGWRLDEGIEGLIKMWCRGIQNPSQDGR